MALRQYWPSAFDIQSNRPVRHRHLTPLEDHRDKRHTESIAGDGPYRIHCPLTPDGNLSLNPDNTPWDNGHTTPPLLRVGFPNRPTPPRLYRLPMLHCAACNVQSDRLLMACVASGIEGDLEKCCGRALCMTCTYEWLSISCTCFACGARAECYEQCGIGINISAEQAATTDDPMNPRVINENENGSSALRRINALLALNTHKDR